MAFTTISGSITSPTSTGNQSTTGTGFTPKVIFLWSNTLSTGGNGDTRYGFGVGMSSTKRWTGGHAALNAAGTSATGKAFRSNKVLTVVYINGTVPTTYLEADLVSLDSDGFTLNWTTVQASGYPVHYLAMGGDDLLVNVGTFDSTASTGNVAVTGVGFLPVATLIGSYLANTTEGVGATLSIGLGVGIDSSNQWAFHARANDASDPTVDKSYQRTTLCVARHGTAIAAEAAFVSNDSDGFTINLTTNNAAKRFGYVSFAGILAYAGAFDQPSTTGDQTIDTDTLPSVTMFCSRGLVSSTSIDADNQFLFGVGLSSSDRRCVVSQGVDNLLHAGAREAISSSEAKCIRNILSNVSPNNPTTKSEADFVSNDPRGFTINWSTADSTARQILYFTLGQVQPRLVICQGVG